MDTCLCIFKTKQLLIEYGHGNVVNKCKCSCSEGVESVDGVTVLGKLQNECWATLVSYTGNESSLDEATSWNSIVSLCQEFKRNSHSPKTQCMVKIC